MLPGSNNATDVSQNDNNQQHRQNVEQGPKHRAMFSMGNKGFTIRSILDPGEDLQASPLCTGSDGKADKEFGASK
jgi:hypothetical protein